jgi:hypothetical protein
MPETNPATKPTVLSAYENLVEEWRTSTEQYNAILGAQKELENKRVKLYRECMAYDATLKELEVILVSSADIPTDRRTSQDEDED